MGPRFGTVRLCLPVVDGFEFPDVVRAGVAFGKAFPLVAADVEGVAATSDSSFDLRLDKVEPVPLLRAFRNPPVFSDAGLDDDALASSFAGLLDNSLVIEGCLFRGISQLDVDAGGETGILGRFWFADGSRLRRGIGTCSDLSSVSLRVNREETESLFRGFGNAFPDVSSDSPWRKLGDDFGGGNGLSSSSSLSKQGVSPAKMSLSDSSS